MNSDESKYPKNSREFCFHQWTGNLGEGCNVLFVTAYEVNGLYIVSTLPHEIVFEDGEIIPAGNPDLVKFFQAEYNEIDAMELYGSRRSGKNKEEEEKKLHDVDLVRLSYYYPAHVIEAMNFFFSQFQKEFPLAIMTSYIGIRAAGNNYMSSHAPLIAPITTIETARKPNAEKRCYKNKFAI